MKLRLIKTSSEFYALNKTYASGDMTELDGTLRAPCSVTDPVIMVHMNPTYLTRYNYAEIPEFGRFYVIRDMVAGENGLVTISMHVDPLMSFRARIQAGRGYVKRNQNSYDLTLIDPLVKFGNAHEVSYSTFGTSLFNAGDTNDYVTTAQNYLSVAVTVFITASKLTDLVGEHTDVYPPSVAANTWARAHYLMGSDNFTCADTTSRNPDRVSPTNQVTYLMTPLQWRVFQSEVLFQAGMKDGFVSAVALPFAIDMTRPNQGNRFANPTSYQYSVYCNDTRINPTSASYLASAYISRKGSLSNMMKAGEISLPAVSDFTQTEPYTTYELYLPFVGIVPVPSSALLGHTVELWYQCDLKTGEGTAYLYQVTDENPRRVVEIYSSPCRIGTRLSIDVTNERENDISRQANALNTAVGLVASVVSIGAGVASANPVATVGGVLSAGKTIAGAISAEMNTIDRANVSLSTPEAGWFASLTPFVRTTRLPAVTVRNADFASRYGLPHEKYEQINTLSGFTVFDEVEIFPDGTMTEPEHNELESLMRQGVLI